MRLIGPALLTAILGVASFPLSSAYTGPFSAGLWPLIFIFALPLYRALDRESDVRGGFVRSFLLAFVFGCFWALGMGYWLLYAMIVEYEVSVLISIAVMLAGVMATHGIFFGAFGAAWALTRKDSPLFHLLVSPSLWVLFEYLREAVPVMTPWGLSGYGAYPFLPFVQFADIAGVYGVSFAVMAVNGGLHWILRDVRPGAAFRKAGYGLMGEIMTGKRAVAAAVALLVLVPALYGALRMRAIDAAIAGAEKSGKAMDVLVVQGNYPNRDRWSGSRFHEQLRTYLGLTGSAGERARLIVWPETVLNSAGNITPRLLKYIAAQIGDNSTLIVGGVRAGREEGLHNSALMLTGSEDFAFYDKNILLPYAETAPFGMALGEYYRAPAEFRKGATHPVVKAGGMRAGISICFEALYPAHARNAAAEGAQVLVNISNEAWFGPFAEPEMQLRAAAFRAMENRRYMIRASNSGISAIVSPAGSVLKRSSLFRREKVSGTFSLESGFSAYTRLGDWILLAAALVVLARLARMAREGASTGPGNTRASS